MLRHGPFSVHDRWKVLHLVIHLGDEAILALLSVALSYGAVRFAARTSDSDLPCSRIVLTLARMSTSMARYGRRSLFLISVPWPGTRVVSEPAIFPIRSIASSMPLIEPPLA